MPVIGMLRTFDETCLYFCGLCLGLENCGLGRGLKDYGLVLGLEDCGLVRRLKECGLCLGLEDCEL